MKRRIDADGFYVDDETTPAKGLTIIEAPCPVGLFRPKWDGKKWIEGGSAPITDKARIAALEKGLLEVILGG